METINITDQFGGGMYIGSNCIAKVYNLTLPEMLLFLKRPLPPAAHWSIYNNTAHEYVNVEKLLAMTEEDNRLTDPVAIIAASLTYHIFEKVDHLTATHQQSAALIARWAAEVYQTYYLSSTEQPHPAEDTGFETFINTCAGEYLDKVFGTAF
ncbi:hypothetical protein HNQ91_000679 [Filimonas zeae]|uniref:Uncharacterized protein n=1 Tax=Filimonas zeae TaxID=1737353 RepID=A0A917INL0_9BACT|nr:hypothetical protein [Filimonas zeae]MDR6337657.1 hypothetical protein [Filimonas zeae]GGH59661.1 hypothetical protein GCM10011379_06680 [Filimonas zeae]